MGRACKMHLEREEMYATFFIKKLAGSNDLRDT
jgi:hypothetical protein